MATDNKASWLISYANTWIRQKNFEYIGERVDGHKHQFDHVSILAQGTVTVDTLKEDGTRNTSTHTGPKLLVMPKGTTHSVTSVSGDPIWFCIFADETINGEEFRQFNTCEDSLTPQSINDIELSTLSIPAELD